MSLGPWIFRMTLLFSLFQSSLASAQILDWIDDTASQVQSDIQSNCAHLLGSIKGAWLKTDFLKAIESGDAKKLKAVEENLASRVFYETNGLVMGLTYTYDFLAKLFREGDELYAYDGMLMRLGKDNSVRRVPEALETILTRSDVKGIEWVQIRDIRLSWAKRHVFPNRPDIEKLPHRILGGFYSSWKKQGNNFVYEAQIKGKNNSFWRDSGFLNLKIVFKPETTEFYISERTKHPADSIHFEGRQTFIAEMKETELASLMALVNSNRPLVVEKGNQTEQIFRYFEKYDLKFMFFY